MPSSHLCPECKREMLVVNGKLVCCIQTCPRWGK